jgi:hypothetical protein
MAIDSVAVCIGGLAAGFAVMVAVNWRGIVKGLRRFWRGDRDTDLRERTRWR